MNNEEWCKKNCPYSTDCACDGVCNFVLSLLKEQEVAYQGAVELLRQKTILFDDAIKRLKKQEPILLDNQHKPYGISTNANSPWISRCPRCGKKVEGKQTRFCKYCGQAVKWNEP